MQRLNRFRIKETIIIPSNVLLFTTQFILTLFNFRMYGFPNCVFPSSQLPLCEFNSDYKKTDGTESVALFKCDKLLHSVTACHLTILS